MAYLVADSSIARSAGSFSILCRDLKLRVMCVSAGNSVDALPDDVYLERFNRRALFRQDVDDVV